MSEEANEAEDALLIRRYPGKLLPETAENIDRYMKDNDPRGRTGRIPE
jgi:hypothetical protein